MKKKLFFKDLDESKIKKDLIWNYISLAFLGFSGIGINIFIGLNYQPSILGAFNQVLVTYLITGILGSWGINYSVLRSLAQNKKKQKKVNSIIKGALIPTFFLSILFSIIYFKLINFFSILFSSENVRIGMVTITPAIFFFSLNKVILLGIINGMDRMRAFSLYQSLRYSILFLSLLYCISTNLKGQNLPIIFVITEFVLFTILIIDTSINYNWWESINWFYWTKKHIVFGFKSLLGSIFTAMNTRIDIIMIGIFLNDEIVGIYSFSALFAEGFLQLVVVLQNSCNPILANLIKNNKEELNKFVLKVRDSTYKFISLFGFLAIVLYPLIISLITNKTEYMNSYLPFSIILIGIISASGYLPFQNILIMMNKPLFQTLIVINVAIVNIILNTLFIPFLGVKGASIGTALSYISYIFMLKYFSKKANLKI
tara:strand:+ start:16353 stop:17636 length:1284 start_codon:yes stop_codon:yes gene_type:complete